MRTSPALPATLLLCLCFRAQAQEDGKAPKEPPPFPGGTVTGRVVFADSNGPARFAKVLLKSAVPSNGGDDFLSSLTDETPGKSKAPSVVKKAKSTPADEAEQKANLAASAKFMSTLTDMLVATTVGVDGTYVFTNVKAGTYYPHALAPGYIDPLSQFSSEELTSTDPAIRQKIAAVVTPINVTGTDQVRADLRLERGASISGRVLYDDGTSAVGWIVRTVHEPPPGSGGAPPGFLSMGVDLNDLDLSHASEASTTDDTGHFRIPGLPTGSYLLQARLIAPPPGHSSFNPLGSGGAIANIMGLKLIVYSGNSLRKADAKAVSVRAGDDRAGYDITVPLHTMHSLSGLVVSKADGHPVSGGSVSLTLQDANGKDDSSMHMVASIQADGSFHFDYIPGQSTYTLKAVKAVDATTLSVRKLFGSTVAEQKTTHSYGPGTTTALLGDSDVPDVKLAVPELSPTP